MLIAFGLYRKLCNVGDVSLTFDLICSIDIDSHVVRSFLEWVCANLSLFYRINLIVTLF